MAAKSFWISSQSSGVQAICCLSSSLYTSKMHPDDHSVIKCRRAPFTTVLVMPAMAQHRFRRPNEQPSRGNEAAFSEGQVLVAPVTAPARTLRALCSDRGRTWCPSTETTRGSGVRCAQAATTTVGPRCDVALGLGPWHCHHLHKVHGTAQYSEVHAAMVSV